MGWATLWQPSKQELLGNAVIFHSSYIAQPAKSSSSGDVLQGLLQFKHLSYLNTAGMAYPLLSFGDAHDASEASVAEDLDLVGGISLFGSCLSTTALYTNLLVFNGLYLQK